jgi:PAS domain S-box-containing protein
MGVERGNLVPAARTLEAVSQEVTSSMCDVAHMQASIDSSQDLIWSVDLNFALVTYNKAFALHFKNNRGVIIAPGMLSHETLPPEAAALWPPMYQLVLDKGPCRAHYPLNDGRFLDLSFVPIRQNGSVVGISILGRDITEQKAALERLSSTLEVLRASESRYRIAFQTSMDAMSITRFSDGVYLDVNEAALNGFGFTREEFIGRTADELNIFVDREDRKRTRDLLTLHGECRNIEFQMRRKGGETFWALFSSSIIDIDGTACVLSVGRDISEARAAKQAIESAEQKYREIFEHAPEGIFQTSAEGKAMAVNTAGARMLGYESSAEAVAAITDSPRQAWLVPEDRERYAALIEEHGEVRYYPCQFKRADGSPIWVSVTARRIAGPDGKTLFYQGFIEDLTERKKLEAALKATIRELQLLSEMNNALLHAATEEGLLREYCRVMVETGGYRMAWVGFAEDGPGKHVVPVASFGDSDGYLESIDICWDDSPRGKGPTGRCIKSGKVEVADEILNDPHMTPWREHALRHGFRSSIALPFRHTEGSMAVLTAYGEAPCAWTQSEQRLLEQIASDLGFGITTLRTAVSRAESQESLRASLEQTIQVIAETVDRRDPYTAGHQRRVADLCVRIAAQLGMSDDRIHGLSLAAAIHDLGKIGIPSEILSWPGRLTPSQFNLLKEHVQFGYDIIKDVKFPWPIATIILQHHERLNGSGYPNGTTAEHILMESRILAVADVVEAMSSHRPYRPARGIDTALEEIQANSDVLYDAAVVDACIHVFRNQGYAFPE